MTTSRIPDPAARPRRIAPKRRSTAPHGAALLLAGLLAAWGATAAAETGAPPAAAPAPTPPAPAAPAPPPQAPGAAAAPESCTDAQCHATLMKGKNAHGATDPCTNCHESVSTPHPQKGVKTFKLSAEPPALCQTCHDAFTKKDVHPPAQEGMCTTCHDPHSSDQEHLLTQPLKDLCATCHSEKLEAKFPHGPVAKGECTVCHAPHESDNDKLLLKPEKETCLGCHKTIVTTAMTTLHGPVASGHCTACHDPHGGDFARHLIKEFPAQVYVPYTDTEFDLCFSCHNRDLVRYADTSFATNFRDGERNLHFLHVNNKQKGRSCVLCHALHGGTSPVLIADSVPFGKWSLPLKFVKTETGGSCAPGCHKPQSYDRKNPGKKPAAG
jgi:predicted CXXCH cytochrome family protein